MKRSQKNIQGFLILITIVSLLVPTLLTSFASIPDQATTAGLQSELAQKVVESPDELVRVIVQKADESNQAERYVKFLGGEI